MLFADERHRRRGRGAVPFFDREEVNRVPPVQDGMSHSPGGPDLPCGPADQARPPAAKLRVRLVALRDGCVGKGQVAPNHLPV